MNTNVLKNFAQEARRKLIEQVGTKMEFVLHTDSSELREKAGQIKKLQEAINSSSKEQVIDKVAYIWFNRLMALRFMDANDYQPLGLRVITPKDNYTLPELLEEAKQGNIPDELPVKYQRIYDLLDGIIPSSNAQNEAYKELLIGACNHLNKIFPFLFERINDYAELLIPDDLISEFSIVQEIRDGMTSEDCKEVEIIGWLYQFYISEKKDEVFASKNKVKKEDIPAATQLFTPRWIVEYMVQNTVGKLWLQNNPNSKLREYMPYFIESPSVESNDYLKVNSVEEITLLDQACGSGHILVYGFELFTKIYEEEGYNPSEIPKLIIEKNLNGFEIDERAAQLAGMALMFKARSYNRRFFRKEVEPNILCYKDMVLTKEEIKETFEFIGYKSTDELNYDLSQMQQATNYGSLIAPHSSTYELERLLAVINTTENTDDVFLKYQLEEFKTAIEQLLLLSQKYHCLVANPPYMGGGKMNNDLSNYVKTNYPDAKADLITCFVERGIKHLPEHGFSGLVTMESWMFLSSFETFRKKLLENTTIHSLTHFGWHIMRIAFGTVSFIFENSKPGNDFKGTYSYMEIDNIVKETEKPLEFPLKNERYKIANQKDFKKIPNNVIGYWSSEAIVSIMNNTSLEKEAIFKEGLTTANNGFFLRLWHEVSQCNSDFSTKKYKEGSEKVWIPYNKGGSFRKWYGNRFFVVNWNNSGGLIKDYKGSSFRNSKYQLKEGGTFSALSSVSLSARYTEGGFAFDSKGTMFFSESNLYSVIGFLNSKVCSEMLKIVCPTLDFRFGTIQQLPFLTNDSINIEKLIEISKEDWDSQETSWNFKHNEFVRINGQDIEEVFELYKQYWKNKFFQLHKNEEELNRQFIDIYGLQEELTPDVPLEDITILKEETNIVNNQLVFDAREIFAQFISYAVGCMFGRYSLDKEGLILANQGETLEDYLKKLEKEQSQVSFLPDDDNIIPILDDEWFEDDIVGRFREFVKVTFGNDNLEKNLAFVEECIGKDIRKYFVKDFYHDHIKRYKKRPIYWMFSSSKGSFNVLIYMHRYTPDTLSQILNGYLKEYREKLNIQINNLDHLIETGNNSEQTKAAKEKDKLKVKLIELKEYERDILYSLATERIKIDLDDGVLVNYNKFGKAIKEVSGLNDVKTKEKVRKFDWINVEEIR